MKEEKARSKRNNEIKKLAVILLLFLLMVTASIIAYRNIVFTSQESVKSSIKIMLEMFIIASCAGTIVTQLIIIMTVITGDGDTAVKVLEREVSLSEVLSDNKKERVSIIVDKNGKPIKYSE